MIEILGQVTEKNTFQLLFRRLFKKAKDLKLTSVKNVRVIFISTSEIKKLNLRYLGHNKPTDVLSFEELNEIFLCLAQAKIQAKKDKKTLTNELALLFVHGLLHLSGYDHRNRLVAKKMELAQAKILGEIPNRQLEFH